MPSPLTASFRQLHRGAQPLRLPNAWDAGSARLFESLGAPAIATTSAGVAWALGYPDGGKLPADAAVAVVANIARVLRVPLSVDVEHGYSDDPTAVAGLVQQLLDLGVAGINIEDGSRAPELLARKIEAIKNIAAKSGADIFVNARTDVFLAGLVEAPRRVEETLARGKLYQNAGADGLFVPALSEPAQIRAVVNGIGLPLNVLAWPGLPPADQLGELGVHRLSAGSGIAQVLWGQARKLAQDFLESGHSEPMGESSMPYPQLQSLFMER